MSGGYARETCCTGFLGGGHRGPRGDSRLSSGLDRGGTKFCQCMRAAVKIYG